MSQRQPLFGPPKQNSPSKANAHGTKCALLNPRSINNKESSIHELITDNDLDLCALTETWCHENSIVSLKLICPDGYSVKQTPRATRGGGVALLHRDSYKVVLERSRKRETFEHQIASLTFRTELLRVITFYKPEGIYNDKFHTEFCDLLSEFFSKAGSYKPLILGDFNLHVNDETNNYANKFKSTLSNFGLVQHVSFPTHEGGNTLDLVITRQDLGIFATRPDASSSSSSSLLSS